MEGIYRITCVINNKTYIGQSKNIERRFKAHLNSLRKNKHINFYLQNSWNKHGENNFEFKIIQECKGKKELNYYETYWYNYYSKLLGKENLYNLHSTGNSKNMSSIIKEKIGQSNKGKIRSIEVKNHLRELNTGKKESKETRLKISNSLKGKFKNRKLSEEHKEKLRKAHLGKKFTKEHKEKISLKLKGHPNYLLKQTKEAREKIKNNNAKYWLNKKRDEITKQKISDTLKKKHKTNKEE